MFAHLFIINSRSSNPTNILLFHSFVNFLFNVDQKSVIPLTDNLPMAFLLTRKNSRVVTCGKDFFLSHIKKRLFQSINVSHSRRISPASSKIAVYSTFMSTAWPFFCPIKKVSRISTASLKIAVYPPFMSTALAFLSSHWKWAYRSSWMLHLSL